MMIGQSRKLKKAKVGKEKEPDKLPLKKLFLVRKFLLKIFLALSGNPKLIFSPHELHF